MFVEELNQLIHPFQVFRKRYHWRIGTFLATQHVIHSHLRKINLHAASICPPYLSFMLVSPIRGVVDILTVFQGFGFLAPCLSLSVGKTVCLPPSSTIANGALVISLVRQLAITSLMTVPVIMEDIMSLDYFDDAARVLASLDYIAVGGGGLKPIIGDKLHRKGVKILNHFGATELGALSPIFLPTKDYDYNYLRLRSDLGLKLLVLDPNLHGERACKLIGYPFGWDATFELQDRLQYNPQRPDCEVKILGRNDDVIVLATGEKVVPHLLEHMLEQEPSIKRAIMFGHGQAETGILLEPSIDVGGHEELFLNEMWPVIQKANGFMDGHARISTKTAVLIKPSDKVIPISDKGLPQRKEVYSTFDSEIKSVYKHLERDTSDNLAMDLDFNDKERCIRLMVQSCLPFHRKAYSWEDDDDLIHLGMDSLQATRLRRTLNASLRRSGHKIFAKRDLPLDFVYSHPSVSEMAKALDISRPPSNISKTMEDLAGKYAIGPKISDYRHQGFVILLTGSTGNLGARLLLSLSKIVEVKQIICLVRATPAVSSDASYDALRLRQQQSLKERGMALSESAWSKVGFLPWESGASRLGLDQDTYRHLSSIVTDIFHGAWPMDFKRKLPSFEPQIQTVKDLVQLGREIHHAQSGLRPRVILASSIAAVGRFSQKGKQTLVPETVIADPTTALPMGYAQAKWVCEQVMESAHRSVRCEIKPMILRIGQLSGSQATGYWSTQEHIAAMVRASQVLGRTPDLKGVCSQSRQSLYVDASSLTLHTLVTILDARRPSRPNNLGYPASTFARPPGHALGESRSAIVARCVYGH